MNIAIVGSGVAGLSAAWLLGEQHRITLFERSGTIGGHASSVRLGLPDGEVVVDPGAQHISRRSYPTIARLLGALGVRCRPVPMTVTVHSRPRDQSFVLTPSLSWERTRHLLRPRSLRWLVQLWRVLRNAEALERRDDWMTSVDDFLAGLSLSADFRRELLLPFLAGTYDVSYEKLGGISARAMMWYPVHQKPDHPFAPFEVCEIKGGIGSFMSQLAAQLVNTELRLCTAVSALRQDGQRFTLLTTAGETQPFDAVVLALQAHEAAVLLRGAPGLAERRAILERFPYHPTRVAIHGDPRFMPTDRRLWSACNHVFDQHASCITLWIGKRHGRDLFKTWVTHSPTLPRECFHLQSYNHPSMTPAYYAAQRQLASRQGGDNLWTVGSYTQGIDSQESGLRSALVVARELAPRSRNLRRLEGGSPS